MADKVGLMDVKKYFERDSKPFENAMAFSKEWKSLTAEDQTEMLGLLQKEADAGRYVK